MGVESTAVILESWCKKRMQGREQELNRWMERKREGINREVCEVVRLGREMQRNYGGKAVKKGWKNARRKERERLRKWERKRLRNTSGLSSDRENGRRKNIRGQWWRKTAEWERDKCDRGDKRTETMISKHLGALIPKYISFCQRPTADLWMLWTTGLVLYIYL